MYDFDTLYPRVNRSSEKWNGAIKAGNPEENPPLTVADMEFRTAPQIVQAVTELAEFGLWGYTCADDNFTSAVAGWMQRRHGWSPAPEWMVPTPGIVPALYSAVRCFTAPGDGVIIQTPVYSPFANAVKQNGRTLIENPLIHTPDGRYEMDFDDLRQKAPRAKMLILCSPHNPVGRVWTRQELETLGEICRQNNLLVVADEIHCDIIIHPHVHTSWGSLPEKYTKNSIIATSASKTFSLAGLSVSTVIVPDAGLREKFTGQLSTDCIFFNSAFGAVATIAAYNKAEGWLDELLEYIAGNYKAMCDFMQKNMPGLRVQDMQATYLAWVDCTALGLEPAALQNFLHTHAKLYVTPGGHFGTQGDKFVRINLACPRSVLMQAMERLLQAARAQKLV